MAPRGRGTILFTGATASVRGGAGFSAFAGAKHALARAGAESGARDRAEGRACRACGDRRHDRRRLHPRPDARRGREARARGNSRARRDRQELRLAPSPEAQRLDVRDGPAGPGRRRGDADRRSSSFSTSPAPTPISPIARCRRSSSARGPSSRSRPACSAASSRRPATRRRWSPSPPIKGKFEYEMLEIRRFVAKHRLDKFRLNPHFPVNSLMLMRGLDRRAGARATSRPISRWASAACGRRASSSTTRTSWRARIDAAGLDAASLLAAAQTEPVKQKLADNTAAAVERGVFGIPTFFVGKRDVLRQGAARAGRGGGRGDGGVKRARPERVRCVIGALRGAILRAH